MEDVSTADVVVAEQLRAQLVQVEERLVREYDEARSSFVHRLVEQERARFAGARINVYVPILVERAVRSALSRTPESAILA